MRQRSFALVSLLLAAPVAAQANPFVITSTCTPNVEFAITSYPTSATTADGFNDFRCTGAGGQDQLYQSLWFYRIDNDTREYTFNNSATSGMQPERINRKGDRAVLTWVNTDGRGFDARLEYQVYSTGPDNGVCSQCLTVTNNTSAPITFDIFSYTDYDVCGAGGDSATFVGPPPQIEVTDSVCPVKMYYLACGYNHYQTTSFATVRGLLSDANRDDLNDTGIPFGPGDFTNAYQWQNVAVRPGDSASFYIALGCDRQIPCCNVASIRNYCMAKAGTNGLPTWGENPLYVCGETELKVLNGFPGSTPFVILGLPPGVCIPVPPFGMLAVNPILGSFFMPPFGANNVSALCLAVPWNPALCGAGLNMQAFFADPGAVGGIAHTDGCAFIIGSL
ncbi:MAG: hypothetical protein R3F56_15600 [Planctomycetota bacterium]